MHIAVDPEATLHVAKKTDDALDELEANFKECDRATDAVAALLDAEAPALAESVRDLAAREGGTRTKPFAEAQEANWSLRQAVGDVVREGERIKGDIDQFTDAVGNVVDLGVERFQQGVGAAIHFGGEVVDGARQVGENVVDGARQAGENVVDRIESIADIMSGGTKRLSDPGH